MINWQLLFIVSQNVTRVTSHYFYYSGAQNVCLQHV